MSNYQLYCGDNLGHLAGLERAGQTFDVIYIDPPYNRRTDMRYKDAGLSHGQWVEFMRPRLLGGLRLLKTSGVIMMSIDDTELAYGKILLDEIFGENNFITNLVWASASMRNNSRNTSKGVDYILVYAKDKANHHKSIIWREPREGVDELLAAGEVFWKRYAPDTHQASKELKKWLRSPECGLSGRGLTDYNRFDENGRLYRTTWLGRAGKPSRTTSYEVLHPVTGKPVAMPKGGWRYPEAKLRELIKSGAVRFGPDENQFPYYWRYLDESNDAVPRPVFTTDKSLGHKALKEILGYDPGFDFPKDPAVLARWIKIVTAGDPNASVLDFFAGSGSTLHAVADLNRLDGGTRSCVVITNNENQIFDEVLVPRAYALSLRDGFEIEAPTYAAA